MLNSNREHVSFPKPEKKEKIKTQWKSGQKKERIVPEWKKDILAHHTSNPSKADSGVLSNAYRACGLCHIGIEGDEEIKQEIIALYELKFGEHFYFDEQDFNELAIKQAAIDEVEQSKQKHSEQLEPIVELLTVATGRMLKAKELRLLDKLGVSDMATFAKLLSDVIGAGLEGKQPEFGYGKFND